MKKTFKMSNEKRMKEIILRLNDEFPVSKCALNYSNVFELLVATILSAQCTDKRVNIVTSRLFEKYERPEDYAGADLYEFQNDIHSTGFYRNKGKNIVNMAKMVVEKFGGKVPDQMSDLLILPGVARKTANVVLGIGFGKIEGIVVDTHVSRIAARLGFTKENNAVKIERVLMDLVDEKDWIEFSLLLIAHGRKTCKSRKPKCKDCELVDLCPRSSDFLG